MARLSPARRRAVRRIKAIVWVYRLMGGRAKFVKGWKRRGAEPPLTGREGLIEHIDVSASGESLGMVDYIVRGRPDLPGPLYNFWTSYGKRLIDKITGRRSKPTLYVGAAGVANHAGPGAWNPSWTKAPHPRGNSTLWGYCVDFRPGEDMHPDLMLAIDRFHVAVMIVEGWTARFIRGHKEWAPGRKTDPPWSMDAARGRATTLRKRVLRGNATLRSEWKKNRTRRKRKQKRARKGR